MCLFLVIMILILVFYGSERLIHVSLVDTSASESIVLAQGWEVLWSLWPFLLASALVGVLFVMIVLKFTGKLSDES